MESPAFRERLVAQLMTDGGALDTLKVSTESRLYVVSPMHEHLCPGHPHSVPVCSQKALRQEVLQTFRLSTSSESDGIAAGSSSKAVNALIVEHLKASKLPFTLAVFQREAGCKHTVRETEQLLSLLHITPGTQLHNAITSALGVEAGSCFQFFSREITLLSEPELTC